MFGTTALDASPDVKDHEPVLPVTHVDESINDLDVVQKPAAHRGLIAFLDFFGRGTLDLPACDFSWIFRILEIDDAE